MGVATPSVAVLVDEVPNAAIVATKAGPTVVLTTGLVSALSVVELEGVLAHLLARQRLEAVERGTAGGGVALLLGALGRRGAIAHRLIGQGRLLRADEVAALAVRYPPGLAAALGSWSAAGAPAPGSLFALCASTRRSAGSSSIPRSAAASRRGSSATSTPPRCADELSRSARQGPLDRR